MKIDFSGLLIPIFVVLVVLKLGNITPELSWLAVTAPIWLPLLLFLCAMVVVFIVALGMALAGK